MACRSFEWKGIDSITLSDSRTFSFLLYCKIVEWFVESGTTHTTFLNLKFCMYFISELFCKPHIIHTSDFAVETRAGPALLRQRRIYFTLNKYFRVWFSFFSFPVFRLPIIIENFSRAARFFRFVEIIFTVKPRKKTLLRTKQNNYKQQ